MSNMDTPEKSWVLAISFYDGFQGHDWWSFLGPFKLSVVDRLAASDWSKKFWASQSHAVLVISPVSSWPERVKKPRVCLNPLQTTACIYRYGASGAKAREFELPFANCWPAIEEALTWLEAESRTIADGDV